MASTGDLRLTFRERTMSPISPYISTNTSSSSTATIFGLGADLGRFLHWFGEHVLDVAVDIVIHTRLASITIFITRKERVKHIGSGYVRRLHDVCVDLLELSRPDYPVKIIRRSLGLILALLRPVNFRSSLVLDSDFIDILANYGLELCGDSIIINTTVEIMRIANAFGLLPCHCAICLRTLSVELGYSTHINELYDACSILRPQEEVFGKMIAENGFSLSCWRAHT